MSSELEEEHYDAFYVPISSFEIEEPHFDRRSKGHEDERMSQPHELLFQERKQWRPPQNLDLFLQQLYVYYCNKGFYRTLLKWTFELFTLGFAIVFSGVIFLLVDWPRLLSARCGLSALEEGMPPCNLMDLAFHRDPAQPLTFIKSAILFYLLLFSTYWLFCLVRFFYHYHGLLEIKSFCNERLGISETELQTMSWPAVVQSIVLFQKQHCLCLAKDLTALDIVTLLLRRENYLVAMVNKGVLATDLPRWIPGVWVNESGSKTTNPVSRKPRNHVLTKVVEWSLAWCIMDHMFDSHFSLSPSFLESPRALRRRFRVLALLILLLSPFILYFLLLFFIVTHAQLIYHQPGEAGARAFSNLARWTFREINEVDHLFVRRLNAAYFHSVDYCLQFPSPVLSTCAQFLSFVFGSMAAVLIFLGLMDQTLLEAQLFGRSLLWHAAILGSVVVLSRSLVTDPHLIFEPEECMARLVRYTHFLPRHWRGRAGTHRVRDQFQGLFQFKVILFLEEMVSVLVAPALLWFYLPKRAEDIVSFVRDNSAYFHGIGHVCSLSVFDFDKHGNSKYGSPTSAAKPARSSQGKLEKSFLSFASEYRGWEPSGQGRELLERVQALRESQFWHQRRREQGQHMGHSAAHSQPDTCTAAGEQEVPTSLGGDFPPPGAPGVGEEVLWEYGPCSVKPGQSQARSRVETSVNYEQVCERYWMDQLQQWDSGPSNNAGDSTGAWPPLFQPRGGETGPPGSGHGGASGTGESEQQMRLDRTVDRFRMAEGMLSGGSDSLAFTGSSSFLKGSGQVASGHWPQPGHGFGQAAGLSVFSGDEGERAWVTKRNAAAVESSTVTREAVEAVGGVEAERVGTPPLPFGDVYSSPVRL